MKKILTLLALGIAVKYFLDSEKGKDVKTQVKGWLGDAKDTFTDTLNGAERKIHKEASKMN